MKAVSRHSESLLSLTKKSKSFAKNKFSTFHPFSSFILIWFTFVRKNLIFEIISIWNLFCLNRFSAHDKRCFQRTQTVVPVRPSLRVHQPFKTVFFFSATAAILWSGFSSVRSVCARPAIFGVNNNKHTYRRSWTHRILFFFSRVLWFCFVFLSSSSSSTTTDHPFVDPIRVSPSLGLIFERLTTASVTFWSKGTVRCLRTRMAKNDRWYFSKEQLFDSPSRRCGIDAEKELSYRQQAANFIQDMGQRLQVYVFDLNC